MATEGERGGAWPLLFWLAAIIGIFTLVGAAVDVADGRWGWAAVNILIAGFAFMISWACL